MPTLYLSNPSTNIFLLQLQLQLQLQLIILLGEYLLKKFFSSKSDFRGLGCNGGRILDIESHRRSWFRWGWLVGKGFRNSLKTTTRYSILLSMYKDTIFKLRIKLLTLKKQLFLYIVPSCSLDSKDRCQGFSSHLSIWIFMIEALHQIS